MPKIEEEIETSLELEEPKMFKVLLHNDDYTSMDFVVDVLMSIFHKSAMEAEKIMIQIHEKGMGYTALRSLKPKLNRSDKKRNKMSFRC